MTAKTTILEGAAREVFLGEVRRELGERMTKLLMTAVEAAPGGEADAAGGGRGVVITGAVAGENATVRFTAFYEEATALALAGALRGIAPEQDEDTIAAFSAVAGDLAEALAAGARAEVGARSTASIEDLRWVAGPPAQIGHRARIALAMGGTRGTITLDLVEEDAAGSARPSDVLLDLELPFALRLGSVELELGQIQQLDQGAVIPLDRAADGAVSLVVGGRVVARGKLVVVDGYFGIQIESVETAERRLSSLGRL